MAGQLTKASSCDSTDGDATREWLETVLEDYHSSAGSDHCPDIQVLEWRIGSVRPEVASEDSDDASTNAAASPTNLVECSLMELLAVHASYSVCGAATTLDMVAKVMPQDLMTRAFIRQWGLDSREIRFYTEVLPALESACHGLPIPICYHASHKQTAESVLVIEDMSCKGFSTQPLTQGLSVTQATAAVRALSKIHAASVVYITKEKVNIREKFPYLLTPEEALASFHSLVKRGLPLLVKFLQNKSEHKTIRDKLKEYQSENRISEVIQKAFAPSSKLNTIVHCDFWANNLLFNEAGNETLCCVIDWQLVTFGCPTIDLALLMSTSLTSDVRRDYRQTILTTYWSEFKNFLLDVGCGEAVEDLDVADLEEDMSRAEAMAALVMVGSVDLALGVPEREDRVLSILKDYFEQNIL